MRAWGSVQEFDRMMDNSQYVTGHVCTRRMIDDCETSWTYANTDDTIGSFDWRSRALAVLLLLTCHASAPYEIIC